MRESAWILSLALAALYLGLGRLGVRTWVAQEGASFPSLQARPEASHGRRVIGTDFLVERVAKAGFVIERAGFRIFVRSGAAVSDGDHVELDGVFQRDGTILASRVTVLAAFGLKRAAMLVVSLAALGVTAALFIRRCRPRFSTGFVRERPCPTP